MESIQRASLAPFREGVLVADDPEAVVLGLDEIERVKEMAAKAKLRRARICVHRSDDEILQEMLICMYRDSEVARHRHADKEESYLVLRGRIKIHLYREVAPGAFDHFGAMELGGDTKYGRVRAGMWHKPEVLSSYTVFLETTLGPWK